MLGGVLTALTDETIQIFSAGRSSQVTDVWLDFAGVLAGILVGLVCWRLPDVPVSINIETRIDAMTIEQANDYFAALPEGFAPPNSCAPPCRRRCRRCSSWAWPVRRARP